MIRPFGKGYRVINAQRDPALSVAERTMPGPAWPWGGVAAGLLACAFAVVLVWIVVTHAGAIWFGSAPSVSVRGADFRLVRGNGHPENSSFMLESTQDGVAALSVEIPPLQSENYTHVEWTFRSAATSTAMSFAWRTREDPRRLFSKRMQWLGDGIAPLQLDASDGWRGTIIGVALVVQGPLPVPLEVVSVRLPSASASTTLAETFAQWTARVPLKSYAIALPFDAERAHFLPLAEALGIAACMACIAYLLLARRRGWPAADARVLWVIFAAAWLILDLRWQVILGRELALSADRFWGKTGDERSMASEDAALFALARKIGASLPPPPVRVVVLSDNKMLAIRLAYYLYPQNVAPRLPREIEGRIDVIAPDRSTLRSGDNLALAYYSALRYEPTRQVLEWPDGGTLPAELVLKTPDVLLVRIR
jgi:hypothetical protein